MKTYAQRIELELSRFFDDYFPRKFNYYVPMDSHELFAYYCNFTMGISLVIFLPLLKDANGDLITANKRLVNVIIKKTGKKGAPFLIELTDTTLKGLWRDRLKTRVSILLELMETQIHKCTDCDVYMIPKTYRTRKQRTQFVTTQCPVCHKYRSTEFGTGLKTILHQNLKKKRS